VFDVMGNSALLLVEQAVFAPIFRSFSDEAPCSGV
jgi:hypothetical protein